MGNCITMENSIISYEAIPNEYMELNSEDIILTRYLYIKDEVQFAFMTNLLDKNDDCIFWAYEYYYSGFQEELWDIIISMYYWFFATLNPSFETYLWKKHKEWKKTKEARIISVIVQNLIIRPFNVDVFMLVKLHCKKQENRDNNTLINTILFNELIELDLISISNIILDSPIEKLPEIYEQFLEIKSKQNKAHLLKIFYSNRMYSDYDKTIILAKIIGLYSLSLHPDNKGRDFYVRVKPTDIEPFATKHIEPPYRLLKQVCICNPNKNGMLCLFPLRRKNINFYSIYENWLYYASFCPIWHYRIAKVGGADVDHEKKEITFLEEDSDDKFYNKYNFEPDEQSSIVKQTIFPDVPEKYDWVWFYETYNSKGLLRCSEKQLLELHNF